MISKVSGVFRGVSRLRSARRLLLCTVVFGFAGASLVGCSKAKEPWEVVYPAEGVVTYQGKPVGGARIRLIPQDPKFPSSVRPGAVADDSGNFVLGTNSSEDGAPAGEYKVIVTQFPMIASAAGTALGKNTLPEKYAKLETTDLTVTVKSEGKELPPLELK